MIDVEFDHKAAREILQDLQLVNQRAEQMAGQIGVAAETLKTAWTHEDARKLIELLQACVTRYKQIAQATQATVTRLAEADASFRAKENERKARLDAEMEANRRRWEEEAKFGPKYPPWQASVH